MSTYVITKVPSTGKWHVSHQQSGWIAPVGGPYAKRKEAITVARLLAGRQGKGRDPMTDRESYSHLHVEAALCLWEAMCEANQRGWERDPENERRKKRLKPLTGNAAAFYETWRNVGAIAMRHMAIYLADDMLKTWDSMTEAEQEELFPYDWEFAPAFLAIIQWDRWGTPVLPNTPREMAKAVLAFQRKAM
ncbi:hypothetical protein GOE07_22475 [Sinorhizobium medicae]|nr:hypothetical protein [Sinorhizobium medicae]